MRPMLLPGMRMIGPALYLEQEKALVIADLHLGAEASLVGRGVMLPRTQHRETMRQLQTMLERMAPERILVAGDVKHDFGTISDEEWRETLHVLDFLERTAKVTIIKGNHDAVLEPILKKRGVRLHRHAMVGGYLVMHGDEEPSPALLEQAKGLIIGHEHPSLLLDDGVRKEKYKCFLVGRYAGKELIVLPSMYPLVEGSDVLREKALGPVLAAADNLHAFAVEGLEVLYFGPANEENFK